MGLSLSSSKAPRQSRHTVDMACKTIDMARISSMTNRSRAVNPPRWLRCGRSVCILTGSHRIPLGEIYGNEYDNWSALGHVPFERNQAPASYGCFSSGSGAALTKRRQPFGSQRLRLPQGAPELATPEARCFRIARRRAPPATGAERSKKDDH